MDNKHHCPSCNSQVKINPCSIYIDKDGKRHGEAVCQKCLNRTQKVSILEFVL